MADLQSGDSIATRFCPCGAFDLFCTTLRTAIPSDDGTHTTAHAAARDGAFVAFARPSVQRFRESEGIVGGLAAVRVAMPLRDRYGAFVEVEGKTDGWVAGNVSLDSDLSLRFGLFRWIG